MRTVLSISSLLTVFVVSACGGNGGSRTPHALTPYDEIVGTFGQLRQEFGSEDVTPETAMPDLGGATYTGHLALSLADAPISSIASDISIDVDFETRTVSGHADRFHSDDGRTMTVVDDTSSPTSTNRILFYGGYDFGRRPDYTIDFDLTGNLMTEDGIVVRLDVAMDSDFVGSETNAISGIAAGQATIAADPATTIVGDFLAVQ